MKTIRRGVFETNSSSTHSLTMVSSEDYDKWKNGELLIDEDDDFITKEDAIKEIKKSGYYKNIDFNNEDNNDDTNSEINDALRDYGYKTYDEYYDNGYLESFSSRFTTKSGDEVVAFGKFGYDG